MGYKKIFQGCLAWMAASLLLFSCSSTNEGPEDGVEGAPLWLAISVDLPRFTQSRAGVADKDNDQSYEGSANDQKVTSARVVLYDNNNMALYSFDITSTDIAAGSFTNAPFTIKARALKKANYSVLVLVNPNDKVKAVTNKGNVKSQFEAAAGVTVNDLASTNGVFMTNARGYISTADANWKETQAEAEATNVPVKVQVERAVGKVFISPANGGNVEVEGGATVATATMSDFALDVTNQKTFWMRKPGLSLTGNGTSTAEAPTATETPTTPHYYQYAEDPNMGITTTTEFNNAAEYPQTFSTGGWDDEKGIYVVENTMNANAQKRNNTTRVLVRLRYLPASLAFDATDNNSWADYRGKLMTLKELKQKIADAANQTDEQLKMPVGFKADMAQLSTEEKTFSKSFVSHNLKYYHQGLNIYSTYIRHFDDTKQPKLMAYGRYGVVRNHIYKISVTKVMGPGSPVPPTPDDNPDDNTTTYIAVNTVVAPWNTRALSPIILN